jgi:AcrR family transcriptional regulator
MLAEIGDARGRYPTDDALPAAGGISPRPAPPANGCALLRVVRPPALTRLACIDIAKYRQIMADSASTTAVPAEKAGAERVPARAGRKLDRRRDDVILDATLAVLAESGYDRMTIDMVAAHAGAARATVYRRWATKAELVLNAVARLSQSDVDLDQLPDTGSLREDLAAMILPHTTEDQLVRIRVVTGLLALATQEPRLAEAAADAGSKPWIDAIRVLIRRAVDRGEYPPADVDALAQVIPLMCISRAILQEPITREFSLGLIDGVLLPALRGS